METTKFILPFLFLLPMAVSCHKQPTQQMEQANSVEVTDSMQETSDDEYVPFDFSQEANTMHNLQEVTQSIITMDAKRLAKVTAFPIYQGYPLKDINNELDLQEAMPYLFDDSIRTILRNTTIRNWDRMGWQGIMLLDGTYLWCDDSGFLSSISYESSRKEQYVSRLNEQEAYEGQDPNWKTAYCFLSLDSAYFVRVEWSLVQSDIACRLHFLAREPIDGYYIRELNYFGSVEYQGTCQNEYYTFACRDSLITLWVESPICRGAIGGDGSVLEFPQCLLRPKALAGKRIILQPAFWREVKKWW